MPFVGMKSAISKGREHGMETKWETKMACTHSELNIITWQEKSGMAEVVKQSSGCELHFFKVLIWTIYISDGLETDLWLWVNSFKVWVQKQENKGLI